MWLSLSFFIFKRFWFCFFLIIIWRPEEWSSSLKWFWASPHGCYEPTQDLWKSNINYWASVSLFLSGGLNEAIIMISLAFKISWFCFACSQCQEMIVVGQLQIKCGLFIPEANKIKRAPSKLSPLFFLWGDPWLLDSEHLLLGTAHLFLSCSPACWISCGNLVDRLQGD